MSESCPTCGTTPDATRDLEARVRRLEDAIELLQPLARRYADGRRTYITGELNDLTRELLRLGVRFPTPDGTPWARDGMGPGYCGLSPEEFALGEKVPS